MSEKNLLKIIVNSQAKSGAFPSTVHLHQKTLVDHNVFTTALVLDYLYDYQQDPTVGEACAKALCYLLTAQSMYSEGHFSFYPAKDHPAWMTETLTFDIDDSALCTRILYKYGLWNLSKINSIIDMLHARYCIKQEPLGHSWFKAGVYPTWLDRTKLNNPIDVIANLNMAHLLHESKRNHTEYLPIISMVEKSLRESNNDLTEISPYYSNSNELFYALDRCLHAGMTDMRMSLELYHKNTRLHKTSTVETPICCSYGNQIYWSSSLLYHIRKSTHHN